MFKKRMRHYVSDIDQFLKDFDRNHPEKTESQIEEINKHKRVFYRRDHKVDDNDIPWEDF